jgi:hypothetical protein
MPGHARFDLVVSDLKPDPRTEDVARFWFQNEVKSKTWRNGDGWFRQGETKLF